MHEMSRGPKNFLFFQYSYYLLRDFFVRDCIMSSQQTTHFQGEFSRINYTNLTVVPGLFLLVKILSIYQGTF